MFNSAADTLSFVADTVDFVISVYEGQSNTVDFDDFQQSRPYWIQLCCRCVPRLTETRKLTQPKARHPNLFLAPCDRDLWSLDPQSWSFHALVPCTAYANWHQNRFTGFHNIMFTSLVSGQTNKRTGWEHYVSICPAQKISAEGKR